MNHQGHCFGQHGDLNHILINADWSTPRPGQLKKCYKYFRPNSFQHFLTIITNIIQMQLQQRLKRRI